MISLLENVLKLLGLYKGYILSSNPCFVYPSF
jgi:hypothetical protein